MAQFSHSKVLFTDKDGAQLHFYMAPTAERHRLKPYIEHGGGTVSNKHNEDCIKLAAPGTKVSSEGYIKSIYILDCAEYNKLRNIENYRLKVGDICSDTEDLDIDNIDKQLHIVRGSAKDKCGRRAYLMSEDISIIRYLLNEKVYNEVSGNRIWKTMEILQITDRSWQSMKDRYLKTIRGRLHQYKLTKHEIALLKGELPTKAEAKVTEDVHKHGETTQPITDRVSTSATSPVASTSYWQPEQCESPSDVSEGSDVSMVSDDDLDELDNDLVNAAVAQNSPVIEGHDSQGNVTPDKGNHSNSSQGLRNQENPSQDNQDFVSHPIVRLSRLQASTPNKSGSPKILKAPSFVAEKNVSPIKSVTSKPPPKQLSQSFTHKSESMQKSTLQRELHSQSLSTKTSPYKGGKNFEPLTETVSPRQLRKISTGSSPKSEAKDSMSQQRRTSQRLRVPAGRTPPKNITADHGSAENCIGDNIADTSTDNIVQRHTRSKPQIQLISESEQTSDADVSKSNLDSRSLLKLPKGDRKRKISTEASSPAKRRITRNKSASPGNKSSSNDKGMSPLTVHNTKRRNVSASCEISMQKDSTYLEQNNDKEKNSEVNTRITRQQKASEQNGSSSDDKLSSNEFCDQRKNVSEITSPINGHNKSKGSNVSSTNKRSMRQKGVCKQQGSSTDDSRSPDEATDHKSKAGSKTLTPTSKKQTSGSPQKQNVRERRNISKPIVDTSDEDSVSTNDEQKTNSNVATPRSARLSRKCIASPSKRQNTGRKKEMSEPSEDTSDEDNNSLNDEQKISGKVQTPKRTRNGISSPSKRQSTGRQKEMAEPSEGTSDEDSDEQNTSSKAPTQNNTRLTRTRTNSLSQKQNVRGRKNKSVYCEDSTDEESDSTLDEQVNEPTTSSAANKRNIRRKDSSVVSMDEDSGSDSDASAAESSSSDGVVENGGGDRQSKHKRASKSMNHKDKFSHIVSVMTKIEQWLGLTRRELVDTLYRTNGIVDHAVYYLLHGQSIDGRPMWNQESDKLVQDSSSKALQQLLKTFNMDEIEHRRNFLDLSS